MRDVAEHAGVSVKTVSRVVNLEPHIRPEMVQRVRAAIEELGWVPNGSARALRTGRTGVVGIAVAELRRPYLAGLVEALVTEADRRGMQAAVEPTHRDPENVHAVLDARGRTFDGVVLIGDDDATAVVPDGLGERPVVAVQAPRISGAVDHVAEDVADAATLIARHLAVMGRAHPAILGPDRARTPGEPGSAPSAAMRSALFAAGFDVDSVQHVPLGGTWDRRAGQQAAADVLHRHPGVDSLICVNDEVALGALASLAAAGVDVPGQVAVVGYDNLDDGWFSTPSLTTIDPGREPLARAALDLLADRLSGQASAHARSAVVPVRLVRRESTLGAGAT
ncbi:LacI family transcriptional regulator [Phytoactinopolyspora halotolerans]|uniref:LacI family transcriptional regulator n=2 Tax=Phytoactinopolyspora halotolerans TaxID=1981512 RepID=A0A6L9S616_9ACTN|nr:LacI family transcriptional regulator [Phytoactinopolyspora halotolerans]